MSRRSFGFLLSWTANYGSRTLAVEAQASNLGVSGVQAATEICGLSPLNSPWALELLAQDCARFHQP
jgi:hypothetical protein